MNKHTPGPWKIRRITGTIMGVETTDKTFKGGSYTVGICEAYWLDAKEYRKNKDQIKANMTLIAAAPDMLNALLECEVLLDDYPTIKQMVKKVIKQATT